MSSTAWIRDLAKSSFVYGVLTVGITATYALAIALIGTLYGSYQPGNPWYSFPVIFGLVLLFAPLRERLHRVADNLFDRGPPSKYCFGLLAIPTPARDCE